MGSKNRDAIETARRVLLALAAKQGPDPADVERLRRLAPPLAQLPTHELATNVMQMAQMISAVKNDGSMEIPPGTVGRSSLGRNHRIKRVNQPSRSARKRRT